MFIMSNVGQFLAVFTLFASHSFDNANAYEAKCTRDLLLIVDTSYSIGRQSFDFNIKPFLQNLVRAPRLNAGPDGTQVAMIIFSDKRRTQILLNFGDMVDKHELVHYIGNLKWEDVSGSRTRTDLALQIANEKIFTTRNPFNIRQEINDAVVILTDGKPNGIRNTKSEAVRYGKLLNEKDVVVAGVAVGPSRNRFTRILQEITSSNDNVLGADINKLDRVLEKLVEILCRKPVLRILNDPSTNGKPYMGSVQINNGAGWNFFCDKDWTKADADVVCKGSGFDKSTEPISLKIQPKDRVGFSRDFFCHGGEEILFNCKNEQRNDNQCLSPFYAGVRCQITKEYYCNVCNCSERSINCSARNLFGMPWGNKIGNITSIDASKNELSRLWKGSLGSFLTLESLDLSFNKIKKIPASFFSSTSKLKTLHLSKNQLEDLPKELLKMTKNITVLDFSFNKIKKIPESFFRTTSQLKTLKLKRNSLKRLDVRLLSNLEDLDTAANEIEEILFDGVKQFLKLDISSNRIKNIPPDLFQNFSQLTYLDMSYNRIEKMSDELFKNLARLKNLSLKGNQLKTLKAELLDHLSNLEFLDISEMKLLRINWNFLKKTLHLKSLLTSDFSHCCFINLIRPETDCDAPINTFSNCEEMIKSQLLRNFMWALVVLIFGGNVFSLLMRFSIKDNQRVQNLFACSLCVSDMLMGVYVAGILNKDIALRGDYYRHDKEWRMSYGCKFFGGTAILSSEVSVFTLVLIAYDRYLALVKVTSFKRVTMKAAVIALILIWFVCFIIAVIPAVVHPYFHNDEKESGFYGTNSFCLPLQLPGEDDATAWEYSLAIFGVLNFIAAIYLILVYVCIFYASYKSAKLSENVIRLEGQPKLAKRLAVIVFTDVCCWFPVAILLFMSLGHAVSDKDNLLYSWFSISVIPINSAINPIIYTLGTSLFLKKIKQKINSICNCCTCRIRKRQSDHTEQPLTMESTLEQHKENQTKDVENKDVAQQHDCLDLCETSV